MQHTARGSAWPLENMQCMQEGELLQSSMAELGGMSVSIINTPAAQMHAWDAQREGSHCANWEQQEFWLSEYEILDVS